MAIGTRERIQLRDELTSQGYHWNYIDEWQPKVTLYRHCAMKSTSGEVISPAGTALPNLPGNPDYVAKKTRIGLFPWPPSDSCQCRWCRASRPTKDTEGVGSVETLDGVVPRKRKTRAR